MAGEVDREDLATRINELHAAFTTSLRTAVGQAIEAGKLLIEAKAAVGHGNWLLWLHTHFDGSVRTAENYMRIANHVATNSQLPANLPGSVAAILAKVATPRQTRAIVSGVTEETAGPLSGGGADKSSSAGPQEFEPGGKYLLRRVHRIAVDLNIEINGGLLRAAESIERMVYLSRRHDVAEMANALLRTRRKHNLDRETIEGLAAWLTAVADCLAKPLARRLGSSPSPN